MDCSLCVSNSFQYVGQTYGPSCCELDSTLPHRVIEVDTGEVYGTDNTLVLATKFALLFISNPIRLIPQVAYRIYDLLSGGFIHRAAENKTHVIKEFTITVAKFVLLPIGLIARQIICLLGLVFAFHARVWYGKVEQFFYMAPEDIFEAQPFLEMMGNVTAPCMQPASFYKENNLFRYWAHFRYNPNTCRSLLFQIEKADPSFPKELKTRLSQVFKSWKDPWEAQAIANETQVQFADTEKRTESPYIEELAQLLKKTKEAIGTDQYETKLTELTALVTHRETMKQFNESIDSLKSDNTKLLQNLKKSWRFLYQSLSTEWGTSPDDLKNHFNQFIPKTKNALTDKSSPAELQELHDFVDYRANLLGLHRAMATLQQQDSEFPEDIKNLWNKIFSADSPRTRIAKPILEELGKFLTKAKEHVKEKGDAYRTALIQITKWLQSNPINGGAGQPDAKEHRRAAETVLATEVVSSDDEVHL